MEVAGGKAQVIVANPAGIVCNGCGTINAGRMTLTTGKPHMNPDGSVAGYQVERGVVRIEGAGSTGMPAMIPSTLTFWRARWRSTPASGLKKG